MEGWGLPFVVMGIVPKVTHGPTLMSMWVILLLLCCCRRNKTSEKFTWKKKDLLWPSASEMSVWGHFCRFLALWLMGPSTMRQAIGKPQKKKAPHLMVEGGRGVEEASGEPMCHQGTPWGPTSSNTVHSAMNLSTDRQRVNYWWRQKRRDPMTSQ